MSQVSFVARRRRIIALLAALAVSFSLAVAVADPAVAGGIALSADRWDVDTETGVVSYGLTLSVTGAAAVGQPCQSYCTWRIEAWYRDGNVEKLRGSLAAGPAHMTNDFTLTRTMAPTRLAEITHIRAVLAPDYAGSWATWTSAWTSVSPPYPDGGVEITVNSWDANVDTGFIDYDVTMRWYGAGQDNGPCVSYCRWSLLAYFKDGTVEKMRGALTSGAIYAAGTWSETVPVKGTMKGEVTHLKATLAPYDAASTADTYTSWKTVHLPYPTGTADAVVRTWSVDPATGVTTYNLTGEWKGAAQVDGPCVSYCRWTLAAYYRDATTERLVAGLRGETLYAGNTWTTDIAASGTFTGAATHVKATLEPYDAASTADRYVRWIPVGAPQAGEAISLNVGKWHPDEVSGLVDYDVTITFAGASQVNGPCENVACVYDIETWSRDSSGESKIGTLHSGECLTGCWTASERTSGSNEALGGVTHLRARVYPASCPAPCTRDAFETDFRFVGSTISEGKDVTPYSAALAAAFAANPSRFCEPLLLKPYPNTNGNSLNDVFESCEFLIVSGVTLTVLLAVLVAQAPDSVEELLEFWEGEPAPTEDDRNLPIPVPPAEWEQETGCVQKVDVDNADPLILADIERKHGWGAGLGKSEFYPSDLGWKWLAEYSSGTKAFPDPSGPEWKCRRTVTFWADVGIARVPAPPHPTPQFTVVTARHTGDLLNIFPGVMED